MIIFDPAKHLTVEAGGTKVGNYSYLHWNGPIREVWRLGKTAP